MSKRERTNTKHSTGKMYLLIHGASERCQSIYNILMLCNPFPQEKINMVFSADVSRQQNQLATQTIQIKIGL